MDASSPAEPAPRPPIVLATVAIRDLDATFEVARRSLGSLLGADGRTALAALAGLEQTSKDAIDPDGTAFVLVLEGRPATAAFALPLRPGASRSPPSLADGAQGVGSPFGRTFLVAKDEGALRAIAPYVTRTLSGRAWEHAVTVEVARTASRRLSDALLAVVTDLSLDLAAEARSARSAMGRDPEIGEPEAVAGWIEEIGRRLATSLGDTGIEARADLSDRSIDLDVELTVAPGSAASGLARMAPGDLPLLEVLPADAPLAVGIRRSEPERSAETARSIALVERLLGPRLARAELDSLRSLGASWDQAAGVEGAVALTLNEGRPGLSFASEARDPAAAAAAIEALPDVMARGHLALVGERLGLWSGPPSRRSAAGAAVVRGLHAPAGGLLGESWELAIEPRDGSVRVTAGSARIADRPADSVASRPEVRALLARDRGKLVALGSACPSRLLPLLVPLGGERLTRYATAAAARGAREHAAWSIAVHGDRLAVRIRIPPTEIRALLGAIRE